MGSEATANDLIHDIIVGACERVYAEYCAGDLPTHYAHARIEALGVTIDADTIGTARKNGQAAEGFCESTNLPAVLQYPARERETA